MADKVSFKFDPWELAGIEKPKDKSKVKAAQEEVAEYVQGEVLGYVGEAKSPVSGGSYKSTLSKKYKEYKSEYSSSTDANLELHGDMLDALEVKTLSKGELELGVYGKEQAMKADGHNHSGVFGTSTLPKREFIPKKGQTFKRDIVNGIKNILMEYEDGEEDK